MSANRLFGGKIGQVLVNALARSLGGLKIFSWHLVVHIPSEDVANARLPCFVSIKPTDDSAVDNATHSGNLGENLTVHYVTG